MSLMSSFVESDSNVANKGNGPFPMITTNDVALLLIWVVVVVVVDVDHSFFCLSGDFLCVR